MKPKEKIEVLKSLQQNAAKLRQGLGFAAAHEIIFQCAYDSLSDKEVVVEADGRGGAKLLIVAGNYPIDYSILKERYFSSEDAACEEAERFLR